MLVGRSNRTLRGEVRTRKSDRGFGTWNGLRNFGASEVGRSKKKRGGSERKLGFFSFPTGEEGFRSERGSEVRGSGFGITVFGFSDRNFGTNWRIGFSGFRGSGFGISDRIFEEGSELRGSEFRKPLTK